MMVLPLRVMNTIDKGYSVIVTMPNSMSLVYFIYSLSWHTTDYFYRRKEQLFVRLAPKLYAHLQRQPGTPPLAT